MTPEHLSTSDVRPRPARVSIRGADATIRSA
jgi:hypothetical protein